MALFIIFVSVERLYSDVRKLRYVGFMFGVKVSRFRRRVTIDGYDFTLYFVW